MTDPLDRICSWEDWGVLTGHHRTNPHYAEVLLKSREQMTPQDSLRGRQNRPMPEDFETVYARLGSVEAVTKHFNTARGTAERWLGEYHIDCVRRGCVPVDDGV